MSTYWWEQMKKWIVIFLLALFFLGVWIAIGWELSRLGPWGITAAISLFIVQVGFLFGAPEWGISLHLCAWFGITIWEMWRFGHWWGLGVAVFINILIALRGIIFLRSKFDKRTMSDYLGHYSPFHKNPLFCRELARYEYQEADPLELLLFKEITSGRVSTTPVHRKSKSGIDSTEINPVDCTVFAPEQIERKQSCLLQVFLHAPGDRNKAESAAQKSDCKTDKRGYRSLVLDAPIGTLFSFSVEIDGFVLDFNTDTLVWTGRPQAATFRFNVPKRSKWGQHIGTVFVSNGSIPVGSITFQIEVIRQAASFNRRPVGDEARHYHSCFCSYSTLDRVEMLKREQGLRAAGLETFIDAVNLRPGEIWNPKIFKAIDESDLFILIWSHNARASKWVRKETHYALKRRKLYRRPDFCPIPVEGPPIAPVPRSLRAFNFNDEGLLLIRAAEKEAEERARREIQPY